MSSAYKKRTKESLEQAGVCRSRCRCLRARTFAPPTLTVQLASLTPWTSGTLSTRSDWATLSFWFYLPLVATWTVKNKKNLVPSHEYLTCVCVYRVLQLPWFLLCLTTRKKMPSWVFTGRPWQRRLKPRPCASTSKEKSHGGTDQSAC